jgi:hypothetical protein
MLAANARRRDPRGLTDRGLGRASGIGRMGTMSNESDNCISMKTISKVVHVYGAEPAGILLQMTTNEGEVIDVFLSRELVSGTRDILQAALEKYLDR